MLKKINRLKSRKAFCATYSNNLIISDENIVLYTGKLKTDLKYPTRVGFVVSKKIHKRAVKRNRIKRLLRECVRLIIKNKEDETINNYQSLIFIAKTNILNKNFYEINKSVLTILNKLANKNIH